MARAGDELVNRVTGLRTIFRKTAKETNGELLQVDWIGDPGWSAGPRHVHPYQEERFTVLSGTLGSHVDGVERVHGEGEVVVAPAGSIHSAWNAGGDDEVHALVEFRPALRSKVVLETLAGLARDGKTNKAGVWRRYVMVRAGEVPENPISGQRIIFCKMASDTGGEHLEVESIYTGPTRVWRMNIHG